MFASLQHPAMRHCVQAAVFYLATAIPCIASAQVARMEVHPFQSMTLTDQEFLTGRKDGKPVMLAGELRLPRPGTERLPLVILVHGSGGVSGYVTDWEQDLLAIGVATFVLDSFAGRGIVSVINDQAQLGRLAMILDAYRALELLERHPRIDPSKIAIMGFSRGGQAALYSSLKRFQRMHGPASGREFAGYVALYPPCGTSYLHDDDVSANPIRLFHGTADNYVPITSCRGYVARLKAKGADVSLTEYEGAHHVFDWQALKKPVILPKAQTTRQCQLEEAQDGRILNAKSKQPFTYSDPCVEYGPTIAYDEKASAEVRRAVKEFVTSALKP
jgi:dienelactone hydrolase